MGGEIDVRIAVLADVHGNSLALQAVVAEIRGVAPDVVINLGDCLAGPFDPAAAAALQMAAGGVTISGNHDRGMLEGSPNRLDVAACAAVSPAQLAWLAGLPATARLDEVFACHGSPAGGDLDNLLDEISGGSSVLAPVGRIGAKLVGVGDARMVLCGHSHVPRAARVGDVLVVNPGSVGMPAFRLSEPVPHAMEAGTPHARYAVLTRRGGVWSFEHRAVEYDWDAAAAQAEGQGFANVAGWTRTGRA